MVVSLSKKKYECQTSPLSNIFKIPLVEKTRILRLYQDTDLHALIRFDFVNDITIPRCTNIRSTKIS